MSSPPIEAASRNISACKAQAVSQVGCRLMVASSAKISRPRLPAVAAGPSDFTFCRNASISGRAEAGAGVCWEGPLLMAAVYTDSKRAAYVATNAVRHNLRHARHTGPAFG